MFVSQKLRLGAPLVQKKRGGKNIKIGIFSMEVLCMPLVQTNGQRKCGGIFSLISISKEKDMNSNLHLNLYLKFLCTENETKILSSIIKL